MVYRASSRKSCLQKYKQTNKVESSGQALEPFLAEASEGGECRASDYCHGLSTVSRGDPRAASAVCMSRDGEEKQRVSWEGRQHGDIAPWKLSQVKHLWR